jgi:hypothetical protein
MRNAIYGISLSIKWPIRAEMDKGREQGGEIFLSTFLIVYHSGTSLGRFSR